jgi:hypothetical protein
MTTSNTLSDFQVIERIPGYDKMLNPRKLSIAELVPVGLNWKFMGAQKNISANEGIDGIPLIDGTGIAVVEAPFDPASNCAYIVNSDGTIRSRINSRSALGHAMFYDVIYQNGQLTFLAAISNRDYQIVVREADGYALRVTETR